MRIYILAFNGIEIEKEISEKYRLEEKDNEYFC